MKNQPRVNFKIETDNTDNAQKAFNYIFKKMLIRLQQERPSKTQLINRPEVTINSLPTIYGGGL